MICPHDGHFTHSPSGTRLLSAGASIGLRTFLNHAISALYQLSPIVDCGLMSADFSIEDCRLRLRIDDWDCRLPIESRISWMAGGNRQSQSTIVHATGKRQSQSAITQSQSPTGSRKIGERQSATANRSGARHVVARALAHRPELPFEIRERLLAPRQIELRGLDDEERRGVVVEEEVVVRLVQLADVVVAERGEFRVRPLALAEAALQHVGGRL